MEYTIAIIVLVFLIPVAVTVTYILQQRSAKELQSKLDEVKAKLSVSELTQTQAETKLVEAEKKAQQITLAAEERARAGNNRLAESERRLDERERKYVDLTKKLDERVVSLDAQEKALEQSRTELKVRSDDMAVQFEKIAGLTKKQAEDKLMQQAEKDINSWMGSKIHEAENQIQTESENKAKEILVDAMQRSATDFVSETTSTTFSIPDEELKGKIVGKEGRNIRTFERLTGVDVIIDEGPGLVTVSSFDPIRREVAALAIQKLLKDGRVHPGAIEDAVKNIKQDLSREILKTGRKIAYDTGFPDLPEEIIKLLGRFKYRFSYGQNLVKHSLEMVNLGQQLAQEIGADVNLTKKACLLHDLGKVLTYEIEGKPHHHISGDIVRKYLKDEKLANAVESHHGDIEPQSIEAVLVSIADAISGARPGARRDSYEEYVKRVKALEDIARQYGSVKEAFAIHAGREVRVIVKPEELTDDEARTLSFKIAKEIEDKQNYPGSVKVTVIREMRFESEAS